MTPSFANEIIRLPDQQRSTYAVRPELVAHVVGTQELLQQWHGRVVTLRPPGEDLCDDPYLQLALVYHRAHLLDVSANYSQYVDRRLAMSQAEVDTHVSIIANLSAEIFKSNLPATLMIVPLRISGLHAVGNRQRDEILSLLDRAFQKGYVCFAAIKLQLQELWSRRESETCENGLVWFKP